jgi:precorrin-2/cobalt-factor-2 C20-methyltransferase
MKSGKELEAVKQALKNSRVYERAKMVVNCTMPGEAAYQSLDGAEGGYFTTIIIGECED